MKQPSRKRPTPRTRQLYDALCAAYQEMPSQHRRVAEGCGVDRGTALNAWAKGWAGIAWARPIKELVEEGQRQDTDQSLVQSAVAQAAERDRKAKERERELALADAEREAARAERVKTVAEEMTILAGMRKSVVQAAQVVNAIGGISAQLLRVITCALYDETVGPDGKPSYTPKAIPTMKPELAMDILHRWGSLAGKVVLAGDLVVRLGQELRGPDVTTGAPDISDEEAREQLEHYLHLYQGIKQHELGLDHAVESEASRTTDPTKH